MGFYPSLHIPSSRTAAKGAGAKMTHSGALMHRCNTIKTLQLYIEHDNETHNQASVEAAALSADSLSAKALVPHGPVLSLTM